MKSKWIFALLVASTAQASVQVTMDYTHEIGHSWGFENDFYNAPFPDDNRIDSVSGLPDLSNFIVENASAAPLRLGLKRDVVSQLTFGVTTSGWGLPAQNGLPTEIGFGLTSGIFFQFTGAIQTTNLPNPPLSPTAPFQDVHKSASTPDLSSAVFLISVDKMSTDYLVAYPVLVNFDVNAQGESGANFLLSMIPLQGVPLRPNTLYAAVVTDKVMPADNSPLAMPQELSDHLLAAAPSVPPGMKPLVFASSYLPGIAALRGHGPAAGSLIPGVSTGARYLGSAYDGSQFFPAGATSHIRGLTVFRTGNPTVGFQTVLNAALGPGASGSGQYDYANNAPLTEPLKIDNHNTSSVTTNTPQNTMEFPNPQHPSETTSGIFDNFCVYEAHIRMPVYQVGGKPYGTCALTGTGRGQGQWGYNSSNNPIVNNTDTNPRILVTIPRKNMPAAGWPTVLFVRGGGGSEIPLVDRAISSAGPFFGGPMAGEGPAKQLADAGWAGVSIDDPLGGNRRTGVWNLGGSSTWRIQDEDTFFFNVFNAGALRDNVRQAALELVLIEHALRTMTIDTSTCPSVNANWVNGTDANATKFQQGGSPGLSGKFDSNNFALMGHSVGATIAPLALAHDANFKQAIFSGAGGSYLSNLLYKQLPRSAGNHDFRANLAQYGALNEPIDQETESAPSLNIIQWAAEPADPPVYNRLTAERVAGGTNQTILVFQGIIDHYIEPPVANAATLSLALPLGMQTGSSNGPMNQGKDSVNALSGLGGYDDRTFFHDPAFTSDDIHCDVFSTPGPNCGLAPNSDFRAWTPFHIFSDLGGLGGAAQHVGAFNLLSLPLVGRSALVQIANPPLNNFFQPNGHQTYTVQDGHEVMFQDWQARRLFQCFLHSGSLGTPVIPDESDSSSDGYYNYFQAPNPNTNNCCAHDPATPGTTLPSSCDGCVNLVCSPTSVPGGWGHPECCDLTNTSTTGWGGTCEWAYAFAYSAGCQQ